MKVETRTSWRSAEEWAIVAGRILRPGEAFAGREQEVVIGSESEIRAEAERRGVVVRPVERANG